MKIIATFILLWLSAALAQTCTDYVALQGKLLEGQPACYFGADRGTDYAYIRTDILTAALGLESSYDPASSVLRFRKGQLAVTLEASNDVAEAVTSRPRTLTVAGSFQSSPSAILAGSSYLPIAPLVKAFGGSTSWNQTAHLVLINPKISTPQTSSSGNKASSAGAALSTASSLTSAPLVTLAAPHYGRHETFTRVAVNVPSGLKYQLALDGNNFIMLFPSARAQPYEETLEDPYLTRLGYAKVGNMLALIVNVKSDVDRKGHGYRIGRLPEERSDILYVDFGATLQGEPIPKLPDVQKTRLASVRRAESAPTNVVLDFGHGGKDPGAVSDYVVEKELVLAVGYKLKALLEADGVGVVLTRSDDTFIELERRAKVAVPSDDNLFVSLHANSTETAGAEGIESWVFGEPQDDSVIDLAVLENGGGDLGRTRTRAARTTAQNIDGDLLREENLQFSRALAESIQHELIAETGSADRGVQQNVFSVLRNARVPAVLVELGFINSPVEGPKLATQSYQTRLAEALARGIERFLHQGRRASRN